jgi:predicted alpha/beta hydrolase family esterase
MHLPTVVFVPGLRDHVADHWQALLQARVPGSLCVPRLGKEHLVLSDWVAALDRTIIAARRPVVLVAHSAGVMMVAHWAARHLAPVRGAILAAPPDFEKPLPAGYPAMDALEASGWLPTPRALLPFRSFVVASTNDPLGSFAHADRLAREWGGELVDAGDVGHLNPASGHGDWPMADELLDRLGVTAMPRAETV